MARGLRQRARLPASAMGGCAACARAHSHARFVCASSIIARAFLHYDRMRVSTHTMPVRMPLGVRFCPLYRVLSCVCVEWDAFGVACVSARTLGINFGTCMPAYQIDAGKSFHPRMYVPVSRIFRHQSPCLGRRMNSGTRPKDSITSMRALPLPLVG